MSKYKEKMKKEQKKESATMKIQREKYYLINLNWFKYSLLLLLLLSRFSHVRFWATP